MYFTVPLTNNITISNSCKCEQKLITKLITPSTAKAKQLTATHVGFHRLTPSLISPIPVPHIAHDTGQDFHQSKGRIKLYDSEVSKNMTACMTPTPLRHHFISCPPIPLRSLQPPQSPQPLQLKLKPKKHRRRGKNKSKRPKQSTQIQEISQCPPITKPVPDNGQLLPRRADNEDNRKAHSHTNSSHNNNVKAANTLHIEDKSATKETKDDEADIPQAIHFAITPPPMHQPEAQIDTLHGSEDLPSQVNYDTTAVFAIILIKPATISQAPRTEHDDPPIQLDLTPAEAKYLAAAQATKDHSNLRQNTEPSLGPLSSPIRIPHFVLSDAKFVTLPIISNANHSKTNMSPDVTFVV
ncbi:hypothetical protein EI94DRAFT_1705639 [Lactarius quietus]|nr:hypothetical protein EI94DRAFT_1705639 [Lactarius quietus]